MEGTPVDIFSQSQKLKHLRLNVPEIVEIADGLREAGLNLPGTILTAEDLVEELCRLK
jgi:energy-coupling factor transport system ATP-binding protein